MFKKKRQYDIQSKRLIHQHQPSPQPSSDFICSSKRVSDIFIDPGSRYIVIGITKMINPLLKTVTSDEQKCLTIYDTNRKCVLCFDIRDLYQNYIIHNVEIIKTVNGNLFSLKHKTINEIKSLVEGYDLL